MSSFSNYLETNIVQSTLRGVAFPVPSSVYVALFTADPTDANVTANEVTTAGVGAWSDYVRVDAAGGGSVDSGWTVPSNGLSTNAKVVTFPANDGNSITITHLGLYTASTGGELLYHAALVAPKTLLTSDVLSFAIGSISVTVA